MTRPDIAPARLGGPRAPTKGASSKQRVRRGARFARGGLLLLAPLAALGALWIAAPCSAQAAALTEAGGAPAFSHSAPPLRWRGPVAAGQAVEIEIVRGSVRVERSSGSEVEVQMTPSAESGDPRSVTLRADTSATRIRIVDRYPPASLAGWRGDRRECLPPDGDGRGDFWTSDVHLAVVVRAPAGVPVSARVMAGDDDEAHPVP